MLEPSFHCSREAAIGSPPPQGDQLDLVDAGGVLQDVLEGVLDQADVHVARVLAGGQLVDAQGAHDGGVDRELIDVDLGEDRVEVHEGARDRDVEGQDALDLESEFQKMFWAMTSIAAAWVRWEMPTARVFSLMFSTSPPSVWNWQSRRKYSETSL